MSKDFRIKQLRTSQIIISGSDVPAKPSALIYSASAATNVDGGMHADLLTGVGEDVWFFVSGSRAGSAAERKEAVLFGGDVVVSGTLYAEKQVIEVDYSQTSDLLLSGAVVLGDQGAGTAAAGRAGLKNLIQNNSGSLFVSTGSLFLGRKMSGTYSELSMMPIDYSAGNGLGRQPLSDTQRVLHLDINLLTASLDNSSVDSADLFALADVTSPNDETKKITFNDVAEKLAGAGLKQTAGVMTLDFPTLTSDDIDPQNDMIAFHDVSGNAETQRATIDSLVMALTGSGIGKSAASEFVMDINSLPDDANAGNLSDTVALADASDGNASKKITITQLKALVDTDTTYSAGDGLDLTSTTFSVDLKSTGGLKIDSSELTTDDTKVAHLTGSEFSGIVKVNSAFTASHGIHVDEYIYHLDDPNTSIRFSGPDRLNLIAGGVVGLSAGSGGVEINPDPVSGCDFTVKSQNNPRMFFVDAGSDFVAIGDYAGIKSDTTLFVSGWDGGAAEAHQQGVVVFKGDVVVSGSLLNAQHQTIGQSSIAQNGTFGAGTGNAPNATGTDSVAIGLRASATGNYSLAIGSSENNNTDATANHALAIGGDDATASAAYASAIGGSTNTATGQYSVAMGRNSNVAGDYSVAIGDTLTTYDARTTIFGSSGSPASAKTLLSSSLEVNQATTLTGDVTLGDSADLIIPGYIKHKADLTTRFQFNTGRIRLDTNGVTNLDMSTSQVIVSPGAQATPAESGGLDVAFYVSGSTATQGTTTRATALFGGDVHISGSLSGPSSYELTDSDVRIFRDGNVMKFDDGANSVKTLTQLATVGISDESTFFQGVHAGSNNSKVATSASISFAGTQGVSHYAENVGTDVYLYVSGGLRSENAAFGRTTTVFGGAAVFSGSANYLGDVSFAAINAASITGSQSVTTTLLADTSGNPALVIANQRLAMGDAAQPPTVNNALFTLSKNSATQAGTSNTNSDFQILLKNVDDGDNSFSGIAFDSGDETDPDSIGAAIRGERDSDAGSNMALHDMNLTFATNDAGDGGLTERMRITHDGKVGIGVVAPSRALDVNGDVMVRGNNILDSGGADAITFDGSQNTAFTGDVTITGGDLIFGNGQNASIDIADASGTNVAGRNLTISGGTSTGNAAGGNIEFKLAQAGSSGTSLNAASTTILSLSPATGVATFAGNIQVSNNDGIQNGDGEVVLTVDADQNVTVANGDVNAQEFTATNGNFRVGAGQGMGLYSMADVVIHLDSDQGSSPNNSKLIVRDGSDTSVFEIDESGAVQMDGDLTVDGGDVYVENSTGGDLFLTRNEADIQAGEDLGRLLFRATEDGSTIKYLGGISMAAAENFGANATHGSTLQIKTTANGNNTTAVAMDVYGGGNAKIYGDQFTIGNDADGTDRSVVFGHSTIKSIIGIDDDQDVFAINTDGTFESANDLEISAAGHVTIQNNLTVNGLLTTDGLSVNADKYVEFASGSLHNPSVRINTTSNMGTSSYSWIKFAELDMRDAQHPKNYSVSEATFLISPVPYVSSNNRGTEHVIVTARFTWGNGAAETGDAETFIYCEGSHNHSGGSPVFDPTTDIKLIWNTAGTSVQLAYKRPFPYSHIYVTNMGGTPLGPASYNVDAASYDGPAWKTLHTQAFSNSEPALDNHTYGRWAVKTHYTADSAWSGYFTEDADSNNHFPAIPSVGESESWDAFRGRIMNCSGYVKCVRLYHENNPGSTSLQFKTAAGPTATPSNVGSTVSQTFTGTDQTKLYEFGPSYAFSAGETINFLHNPSSAPGNVTFAITLMIRSDGE